MSVLLVGAVTALVIIDKLWAKFQTSPTLTGEKFEIKLNFILFLIFSSTFDCFLSFLKGLDTDLRSKEMLFPTVAVCPADPFDMDFNNNTTNVNDDDYADNIPLLRALSKFSYGHINEINNVIKDLSDEINIDEKKFTLRQLIFKIAVSCENLFYNCHFRGQNVSCCDVFEPTFTERGFCYAFNPRYYGTADEEIRYENLNYLKETDTQWSVKIDLNAASNVYLYSHDEVSSYEIPPQFFWEKGINLNLQITMKQTYTTDDAKQLSKGQRKCVIHGEVEVSYHNNDVYSMSMCNKQCRMQKAFNYCKCIPPFYAPFNRKHRYCGISDIACLAEHERKISDIKDDCGLMCELSCLYTLYDVSKLLVKKPESNSTKEFVDNFKSGISIELFTWPIFRFKREVIFGWADLLVSFGGVAGLCLGFSLLSGVEIFYYFTMRASCMFLKNKDKLKELQKERDSRPITAYDLGIKLRTIENKTKNFNSEVKLVKPAEKQETRDGVFQFVL
ncbi:CLUMA_CG004708, isoform A [Clunio marinus]|uniref:CLUMA_CG004708, isoform A n=1 Tax=Clunio marinus TaxID=568069 RepID=A0A1J1HUH6_9DIPT|nr:CLUMA_CG004708, isoform A [Clunio marinus]